MNTGIFGNVKAWNTEKILRININWPFLESMLT